jgi:hypothetical protein
MQVKGNEGGERSYVRGKGEVGREGGRGGDRLKSNAPKPPPTKGDDGSERQ